jgi:hypothetical protein
MSLKLGTPAPDFQSSWPIGIKLRADGKTKLTRGVALQV